MTDENKRRVSFSMGEDDNPVSNSSDIAEALSHSLRVKEQYNDILKKSVRPVTVRKDLSKKYDSNKVVFSSKSYERNHDNVETKAWRRLSDQELREIAQIDPYISAIISTRCSQGAVVARESDSKFDKGTRILDLDPPDKEDFESDEEFEVAKDVRERQSKVIADWISHCGTQDEEIIQSVFSDPASGRMLQKCTLADYFNCQIRNLLTFGRYATQIIRNEEGLPVMFRPLPVETIYPAYEKRDLHVGAGRETMEQTLTDVKEYNDLSEEERPYAYVQRVEGRNVNVFMEDEIKIGYFQKQALFDLNEYPMAPIEMAIYMVFIHQNTLGYLRNQFVKGMGSKGVLTLESSEPGGEMSGEDVEQLRREFHNFLSRTDNSATTPVISGPVKVNWIPLTSNPRDMEFLQVEEHVVRALCSAMQTSPQEMGYGHLSMNQGSLSSGNKQDEIIQGEERGLRMLLDILYDDLNEILYENFEEAQNNFRVSYTGVGEDTKDATVQRDIQELQTTATMSSLWANSEKKEPIPIGADVPLAPAFHSNIARYLKYGEFMEKFFGMEGWGEDKQYDFIIDPTLEQARQQRIMFDNHMLEAQGQIQLKTQAEELESMTVQTEMAEAQNQAMEQQMQMGAQQPGMDPNAPQDPGMEPQEEGPQQDDPQAQAQEAPPVGAQPLQQSMRDAYYERSGSLHKSMNLKGYFGEWMKAHDHKEVEIAKTSPASRAKKT